ncbi:MAG: glycine cleavage system aminomethyltransferase GcvT [Methylotenera sp.]|nr:glycine cleavage system aminomethyltransferase GcvT [Oligoflexia bacterium]
MLKRTALYEEHQRSGGRLIDFGGWELPVQYTGVIDEHQTCRTAAGLFDVSHMGEILCEGKDAEKFLNYLVTNNVSKIAIGQAQYTVMCNEAGGIVDDLIIYRRGEDQFFVVVNASNTDKDYSWIQKIHASGKWDLTLRNVSTEYTQIAIQGPKATEILQTLTPADLSAVKTYWFTESTVLGGVPAIIARTGYTGEDGFEIYLDWNKGPELWRALLEGGKTHGIKPCGLGARDTLRLEVKYPLYGHELGDDTNPVEAGLNWVIKLDKGDFIGKGPIVAMKERGPARALVGLKLTGPGIPRQSYTVHLADGTTRIGELTSGTQSPMLKQSIGVAYVAKEHSAIGSKITVDIRGNKVPAEIVATPFYKRPY